MGGAGGRGGAGGAAEPGSRAPSRPGRREGAWGARGAGQHESAAAGAQTAQPAGGPGAGDGAPPLPGPHQRGEPTGERGARTTGGGGVTAAGRARGIGRAFWHPVAWCTGVLPAAPYPRAAPLLFYIFLLHLLTFVGERAGGLVHGFHEARVEIRRQLGGSLFFFFPLLCGFFHLCGSRDETRIEFVKSLAASALTS